MILRYPGSKNSFCLELDKYVPADVCSVASPFFGGGAYEFHLARKEGVRVVGSDLNGSLVNFWNMTREDAGALASTVDVLGGGMSKERFHGMREGLLAGGEGGGMRDAASFFVLNRTSYNGIMRYYAPSAGRFTPSSVMRLRQFQWPAGLSALEQGDAFEFLEKHPDAFWFLDPPYFGVKAGLYGLDAGDHVFDHERLARFLYERSGGGARWMLTYDDHPEVRKMYEGWAQVHPLKVHYSSRHTNKSELVITHPHIE
jgi:DNA adenine methylase